MPAPKYTIRLKNKGLCTRCGKNLHAENRVSCEGCLVQDKEGKAERKRQGMCVTCGTYSSSKGRVNCERCLLYFKSRNKDRREVTTKDGICSWCFTNPISSSNKARCEECKDRCAELHEGKKATVLHKLGGKCWCCGEKLLAFLTLAHLDSSGVVDRQKHGGTSGVYRHVYKLIQNNKEIPKYYGVECFDCNMGGYSNKGVCPHKKPLVIEDLSYLRKNHKQAILKYGGVCKCCGKNELGFLTIEHINGGGRKELEEGFGGSSSTFYTNLKSNPLREDIEVLCWNCNCAKGSFGICPHKEEI